MIQELTRRRLIRDACREMPGLEAHEAERFIAVLEQRMDLAELYRAMSIGYRSETLTEFEAKRIAQQFIRGELTIEQACERLLKSWAQQQVAREGAG